MTTTQAKTIDRITKLLALATSSNANESHTALGIARNLLATLDCEVRDPSPTPTESEAQSQRAPSGMSGQAARFHRLPDGSWGIAGHDLHAGTTVSVEKRNGGRCRVTVESIQRRGADGWCVATISRAA